MFYLRVTVYVHVCFARVTVYVQVSGYMYVHAHAGYIFLIFKYVLHLISKWIKQKFDDRHQIKLNLTICAKFIESNLTIRTVRLTAVIKYIRKSEILIKQRISVMYLVAVWLSVRILIGWNARHGLIVCS